MSLNLKVVNEPLKVDLHIHSIFSNKKDSGDLVKDGTVNNLNVLVEKLNAFKVNMAAITDHDYFSYDMYKNFKEFEGKGSLIKVLPGVEFSVGLKDDQNNIRQVHVIAIFDDSDEDKLKNIESNVLNLKNGKIQYDLIQEQLFSESKMIEIFNRIGLNVVLIAHQKNSVTSTSLKGADLINVGKNKFNEFIDSEVFEALEFKSMKNGLFNNLFAIKKNRDYNYDVVKFITGSDCHVWESYPAHDSSKMEVDRATEFKHTYLKCLPTFKGLAMALTDYSRIHLGNNFFSLDDEKIHEINISIDSQEISVPLSNGINAIIGDNSIGKSLLLHKLTNFKNVKPTIKKGYLEYLKNKNISINTIIDDSKIYYFDFQGNIRDRFEKKDEANNQSFLNEQFPEPPANVEYIAQINKQFENLYTLLDTKFNYDKKLTTLKTVLIPESGTTRKFVTCIKLQFNKKRLDGLIKAVNYLTKLLATIKEPNELDFLDTSDKTELIKIKNTVEQMIKRYSEKKEVESKKYNIMVGIREGINKYSNDLSSLKSNEETIVENYENDQVENVQTIADLLYLKSNIKPHKFSIDNPIKANFSKLVYSNYSFVRRFKNVRVISNDYLDSVLSRCLKNNKKIDILNITIDSFKNDILKDYSDSTLSPINFLKARIDEIIKDDFSVESVILFNNENIYENLSSGLNSTIYFDIISDDTSKGIYLVDQPEDDVSQLSIKRNLIKDFKNMSQKRQIILVTHNPQFVVNLDVDNVICLYKNDNGKLCVSSGALEYEDDNTNIIKLVADNLDGGADSIRKRWKRYEKDFEVR